MKEKFSSEEQSAIDWLDKQNLSSDYEKGLACYGLYDDYESERMSAELLKRLDTPQNMLKMMRAIINGYEIEEEKYKVILPHRDGYGSRLALVKYGVNTPEFEEIDKLNDAQKFTLAEIESIDPRYLAFKEKVEE